jgi:hypothetical protein
MNAVATIKEPVVKAATVTAKAADKPVEVTLHDTCDRCGSEMYESDITGNIVHIGRAQAFVGVRMPGGSKLKFCGHHFTKLEAGLRAAGGVVFDYRDRINAKNESSAFAEGQEAANLG